MSNVKVYSSREAMKILRKNGFKYLYSRGDHCYFGRYNVKIPITSNNLNRMIWQRIVKENNLKL